MQRKKSLLALVSIFSFGLAALLVVAWHQVKHFSGTPAPPAGPKRRTREAAAATSQYVHGW